jgi:threonine dehydrogenase-like Zn-dependent dehydrogenase
MKTRAVMLHGADDVRLEEFELPEIKDDELLVKVISDSICMSTYKAIRQGAKHKRVPDNVSERPVMVGHEFEGIIVKVGKKWQERYHEGQRFAVQPTLNYKGTLWAPGYSYPYYGGACTYCVVPHEAVEMNCILPYSGESFFDASLCEPLSCVIGGFNSNYHTNRQNYQHSMGTKEGGNILILGGCGPMGLGAISYSLAMKNKPARVVVTEVSDDRLDRARKLLSPEDAKKKGIELIYVNTASSQDPESDLMKLTDGHGYDDVFLFVPIRSVAEMGNHLLAFDGCMNIFAGPMDHKFSAEINLYDAHYTSTHVMGASGGLPMDTDEVISLMEEGKILPAVMVTHIGGLDSYADTVLHLPEIRGGKKLVYTQINMPMTAISDFREKGKTDPFYAELADACDRHNGLWNAEAEKILFRHFGIQ